MKATITHEAGITVPSVPSAAALARHFAGTTLMQWRLDGLVDIVEIVTNEIVANAIRAGSATDSTDGENEIRVRVVVVGGRLFVSVLDQARGIPVVQDAGPDAESGRGLGIVDALCSRWGYRPSRRGYGKIVWAEIAAVPLTDRGLPRRVPSPFPDVREVFDIKMVDVDVLRRTASRLRVSL